MKYFFLDTSNSYLLVAIYKNKTCLSYHYKPCDHNLSSEIMPVIDKVFKQAKISPREIDKIFVVTGPGSFTGVRIGVTIAKIFAWTYNIKIVPISSLELLATTRFHSSTIIPLIDARRGYVYAGVYDRRLNSKSKDKYISLDNIIKNNPKAVFVSYNQFDNLKVLKPSIQLSKIIRKHEKDASVSPHRINPNYLKLTEAEEKLKNG